MTLVINVTPFRGGHNLAFSVSWGQWVLLLLGWLLCGHLPPGRFSEALASCRGDFSTVGSPLAVLTAEGAVRTALRKLVILIVADMLLVDGPGTVPSTFHV